MISKKPSNSDRLALIGYNSLLTASTQAPKALTDNTFERYEPSTGAVVAKFQLITGAPIDYIALAAHNIGTHDGGTEILIQYATTIGGALTDIESITPTHNGALMISFDSITVAEIAITTNAVTSGLELGVVHAGVALQMQQPIFGGVNPIDLSQKNKYQSTMSDSGQFLGRTVTSKGLEASFQWQHLEDDWYREVFNPFVISAVKKPFFIQWRPDRYESAVYGYTTGDIQPTNMGGSRLMRVGFTMKAHSDV